ncbi:NAD(P)-dependent oxidoreductase [Subtercola frigoramans]|uniref:Phosphoglycerate dehydrogenase-like enzyme n=1 Tax=Subtercola frigoramans TaxID=120298 RepID=A0ABS2L2I4_9MICO|nr:NAD(P)-dependent oxidoreductase [Subtercola frigoramans]MBM7470701.1 phosphoglycerate dehydrogenase-like enzyme [Subtercola frigoramans]
MTDPLIWVPFPVDGIGLPPGILERADVQRVDLDAPVGVTPLAPEGIERVRFFAAPYGFNFALFDLVQQMTSLEVLQVQFAGVERLRGLVPGSVTLCSGRGIHDTSVSELALSLTLAALRDLPTYVREQDREVSDRKWHASLAGSRVVVVGSGSIGFAIKKRIEVFEAETVMVGRAARPGVHAASELPTLLPRADVVILALPLTPDSATLFDEKTIGLMKPGALLVNVARGEIVDTDALVAACSAGRIIAALDVTSPEPLPAGHALWKTPGILLTPHIGGTSHASTPRAQKLVADQITRFVQGEPLLNVVAGEY